MSTATAITPAWQKRQVWYRAATQTPTGMKKTDLHRTERGQIVSKKKHKAGKKNAKKAGSFFNRSTTARKNDEKEFDYNGCTYSRRVTKSKKRGGLVYYACKN